MEQQHDDEKFDRIDKAAERYWLQGMDLGYAKRRARVEATRQEQPRMPIFPVYRF